MIRTGSVLTICLVCSVSGTIPEDLGGYKKIYEKMTSYKGETYSFVHNFLLSGVNSANTFNVSGAYGRGLADCVKDLKIFQKAYRDREIWALKMIDASTQLQSGFLQGNTVDLGDFQECIEVHSPTNNIFGQHCFVYYDVLARSFPTVTDLQQVLQGICVPASCSNINLIYLLTETSVKNRETGLQPMVSRCQSKESSEPRVGLLEAVILSCFGVLGAIVLAGTVLDIYLRNDQNRKGINSKSKMPFLELESSRDLKAGNQKYHKSLLAFSVLTNAKELFQLDTSEKSIKCLYGLRFISACFILSIHRLLFDPQPFSNVFEFEFEMRQWYRSIQLNAYLFVDLFFVMSGLLLSYRYSSHIKKGEKLNLVHYYLHRYIRLTPPLLAVVMLDLLLGLLCNGPYCIQHLLKNRDRCRDNAIYTLTYLNNMIQCTRKCIAQSWYLSADMQIYALAPILFFFMKNYRRSVPYLLSLAILTSILIIFSISYQHGFKAGYMHYDYLRSLDGELIYYPFYTRMGPWFIGFALGLKLQNFNDHHYRHSKRILTYGWILAIFCISIAIFGVYPFNQINFQHDRITDSLFKAVYRNMFGLGFAWVIYVCHTGHCDCLNRFLSTPVLQVLGKLSYSFFLIHPFVQVLQFRSVSAPRKYSDWLQGSFIAGDICYSLVFAAILHLAVEAPTLKLEKIFFENSRFGGRRTIVRKP